LAASDANDFDCRSVQLLAVVIGLSFDLFDQISENVLLADGLIGGEHLNNALTEQVVDLFTVRLDIFIVETVKGVIDHGILPLMKFKAPAEAGREAI
ncbi:MAG: hypothetical protein ACTH9E_11760, partial [Serratia proteamaculans]